MKLTDSGNPFGDTLERPYSGNYDSSYAYRKPPVILKNHTKKQHVTRKSLPIATASNEGWTLESIDKSQKARLDESVNLHFQNFGNFYRNIRKGSYLKSIAKSNSKLREQ